MDHNNTIGKEEMKMKYECDDKMKVESMWLTKRVDFNRGVLIPQMKTMFGKVIDGYSFCPYVIPLKEQQSLHSKLDANLAGVLGFMGDNTNVPIEHPHNFVLKVKRSSIDHPESGYGVFVEGEVVPGTLVCIYPGRLLYPKDWDRDPTMLEDDITYMIARYDSVIIDGRRWELEAIKQLDKAAKLEKAGLEVDPETLKKFKNPFGIGQYVNHPPKGSKPNVMPFTYTFTDSFEEDWKSYVPYLNSEHRKTDIFYENESANVYAKGLMLVATEVIKDEELFLNYRFHPDHIAPAWYHPIDNKEAARRWGGTSWIRNFIL